MIDEIESLPEMIGRDPGMLLLYRRVRQAARASMPVLLVGETGTGKELVARALHALSDRSAGPFEAINCAAVPDGIAEAELFGVEIGAFTGATRRRDGVLARARGGTLFLDEICSASAAIQAKLLRALERGEITRLGGTRIEQTAFRLVAATPRTPEALVATGTLRIDLFHRLAPCRLYIPPLRERPGDIVLLAQHFLRTAANGQGPKELGPSAMGVLREYHWPGNVRELEGLMNVLAVFTEDPVLTRAHVEHELTGGSEGNRAGKLKAALEANDWNVAAAARTLGLGRTWLYHLMRECGVERPGRMGG
jgi:DNA-binding NtrC family response regulator